MPSGNFTIDAAYCTGAAMPFLEAPGFDASSKSPLTLCIPGIAGPAVQPGQPGCTIAASGDNTVFALTQWVQKNDGRVYATVTVAADYLYSVNDRDKLWLAFAEFRRQFDALEKSGCLVPGGGGVLARRVAQALPLSYDETLLYTYGLDVENRFADLTPGLRICVDRGAYQYVAPPSFSGGSRNAYAGSGPSVFDVRRRADGTLGFNALLDRFRGVSLDAASPPQISGLLDLESAGTTLAYGRLVYPPQVDNVTTIDQPPDMARNAVLIFAGTLADLDEATRNYVQGGSTGGVGNAFFFSGRDAVWAEIAIVLNGRQTFVPLGTTLSDLLAREFTVSPYDIRGAGFNVNLWRWVQPSLLDPNSGFNVAYAATSVQFNQTTAFTTSGMTQWDVPMNAGDLVMFTYPSSPSQANAV